jgi:hypothetical protein
MSTKPTSLPKREIPPVRSKITIAILDVLAAAHAVAAPETTGGADQNADTPQHDADAPARVA